MQEGLVPFMHDRRTLCAAAAGAQGKRNAAVTKADGRLRLFFSHGEQISPSPKVVTLTSDKLTACLPRLSPQLRLLIPDPAELGYRKRAGDFTLRPVRGDKRDASIRWVYRQVDMLDVLARHGDGDLPELDR